jgi:hypothetical protein
VVLPLNSPATVAGNLLDGSKASMSAVSSVLAESVKYVLVNTDEHEHADELSMCTMDDEIRSTKAGR